LYRPSDVAWDTCSEPDGDFLDDPGFEALFGGDALIGVTAGCGMLEPIMLRSTAKGYLRLEARETTASQHS